MAVAEIKRTTGKYTIMRTHHLWDRSLSLKAKGLLSLILTLPDGWDFSAVGLAQLSDDGLTAVRTGLKELEKHKYLTRTPIKENGKFVDWKYTIYEIPYDGREEDEESPVVENPQVENSTPKLDLPPSDIPPSENPQVEKRTQSNNKEPITKEGINKEANIKGASAKADAQGPDLDTKNFSPELKGKVEEWIQYKKEQRKAYRPTGLRSLLTQIEHNASKYGDHAVAELITECMAANYQGIIFDKLKSRPRVDNQPPMIYDGDDWNPDVIYGQ